MEEGEEVYVSAASVWEIAIKASLGRLELPEDLESFLLEAMEAEALLPLPVTLAHAAMVRGLPWHHKDPFDRLLVAQALREGLALVSQDRLLDAYGVRRVW
jgi:PIN domain nuclease of toxin-antitoxin system